jgi:hypothetical protein
MHTVFFDQEAYFRGLYAHRSPNLPASIGHFNVDSIDYAGKRQGHA